MDAFIRDKINTLETEIAQEEQRKFQHALVVMDSEKATGDSRIDRQLETLARNARTQIQICDHKLAVRREMLAKLEKELDEGGKADSEASG